MVEESDRRSDVEPEDTSLEKLSSHSDDAGNSEAERSVPPELLESVPPEHRRAVVSAFSSFTQLAGPVFNPIFQRITPDHLSQIIDNTENENIRDHEAEGSRRKYQFAYSILIGLVIVGLIVFFTVSDNRDMIAPLVAAVAGFLGGFGVGQRFRQ